ncbi:hypothetical protein [Goodfellowiella coeruleoviolacea]|uniref:hypothetical protein n=1 Tax=Goodfellowiella coeruleoviolacea TaxID=334858 RepID=UPI0020A4FBA1|nr:hypothetical protein [Goodfellowiella coeruleoviolacea]
MRVERFRQWLHQVLAESGHPGIEAVAGYEVPGGGHGRTDTVVRGTDGVALYLRVVRTAPPGGEDLSQPETVITREPGVPIEVCSAPAAGPATPTGHSGQSDGGQSDGGQAPEPDPTGTGAPAGPA